MIAMSIEDMLQDAGHVVVGSAGSVAGAIKLIQDGAQIDCALLDVNLRGEASYPVADLLSQRDIPYAFTSGYGKRGIEPRYAERPVLSKPIDQAKLLAFVEASAQIL